MNTDKFSVRDWIYVIAIVCSGAVAYYRLDQLEKRFTVFETNLAQNYVRADIFKLTTDHLQQEIDENSSPQPTRIIYRDRPVAEAEQPKKYPSIIPQYNLKKEQ